MTPALIKIYLGIVRVDLAHCMYQTLIFFIYIQYSGESDILHVHCVYIYDVYRHTNLTNCDAIIRLFFGFEADLTRQILKLDIAAGDQVRNPS